MPHTIEFSYDAPETSWLETLRKAQSATVVPLSGRLTGDPVYLKWDYKAALPLSS